MSSQEKIVRVVFEQDIKMCWCSYEKMYKPCSVFSPRPGQHGYQYYCKDCAAAIKRDELEPEASIYVREGADNLLKKLGYNLSSELSVYEQFIKKHFLNERIR